MLLWKCRIGTAESFAQLLYPHSKNGIALVRRDIKALVDAGFINRQKLLLKTLPDVVAPIFSWYPGRPPPDYYQLEYLCQSRWTSPPKLTSIISATTKAARALGGNVMKVAPDMIDHDFVVARAYEKYPTRCQEQWVGEMIFEDVDKGFGIKIPDAKLICNGVVTRIIEGAGRYDARRLRSFHEFHFQHNRSIPYDLW